MALKSIFSTVLFSTFAASRKPIYTPPTFLLTVASAHISPTLKGCMPALRQTLDAGHGTRSAKMEELTKPPALEMVLYGAVKTMKNALRPPTSAKALSRAQTQVSTYLLQTAKN
jgi:hypothetical protein